MIGLVVFIIFVTFPKLTLAQLWWVIPVAAVAIGVYLKLFAGRSYSPGSSRHDWFGCDE